MAVSPQEQQARQARGKYPLFSAFADCNARYLTHEESIAATPHDRIMSVWPFLAKSIVMPIFRSVPARKQAIYDPEDCMSELYIHLLDRDAKWRPGDGRYQTFAGSVAFRFVIRLFDGALPVKGNVNIRVVMKAIAKEVKEGRATRRREQTLEKLKAAANPACFDIPADMDISSRDDTFANVAAREHADLVKDAVELMLASLHPSEAALIGQHYGLYDQPPRNLKEIARVSGVPNRTIVKRKRGAIERMLYAICAADHPVSHFAYSA